MAISTVFKGIFFAWLLVGALAQEETSSPTETAIPAAAGVPTETAVPTEAAIPTEPSIPAVVVIPAEAAVQSDALIQRLREAEERVFEEQAANAVYKFATSIVDGIMDNMQARTESRDGLNLTGSYSYSDGFFRRSVHYVADENGYRIVSEDVEPLGNGPRVNPEGQAEIHTSIAGEQFAYNITKADIGKANQPIKLPGRA